MTLLQQVIGRFRADVRGFTALEYTLITVIIGAVALVGAKVIGGSLSTSYVTISDALQVLASGS